MYAYAANNPIKYTDPTGRNSETKYSWIYKKGFREINDNGTGTNKSDDIIVEESLSKIPLEKSEKKFDTLQEALKDAGEKASDLTFKRAGPPSEYHTTDDGIIYIEVNIFFNLYPNGDGSTNEMYEVNRWEIIEEQE